VEAGGQALPGMNGDDVTLASYQPEHDLACLECARLEVLEDRVEARLRGGHNNKQRIVTTCDNHPSRVLKNFRPVALTCRNEYGLSAPRPRSLNPC
jgi:hypothetical protein